MCGIVGIVGGDAVAPRLLAALKRLDYRGYDSAGVATVCDGLMARRRVAGKIANLEDSLCGAPLHGTIGLGHTRWATHGIADENNAHPHFVDGVCIVHNGIIENFAELRRDLIATHGAIFQTQTDSEVVAQLLAVYLREGLDPKAAMLEALKRLKGTYALAVMLESDAGMIMAARCGPPLAVGHGRGEMFLGSDAFALAPFTDEITYLDDGDCAVITRDGMTLFDLAGVSVQRRRLVSRASAQLVGKGPHRHYMLKEIHEQPEALQRVLSHYLDFANRSVAINPTKLDFKSHSSVMISACGTAYLAGSIGKYWFEQYANLRADLDFASEFRYRHVQFEPSQVALFISQSGETADTLASLHHCKTHGLKTAAIVNVAESTIAREVDEAFPTLAGPEIGVASTKAFTCQLAVLACMAVAAGTARGVLDRADELLLVEQLIRMPQVMAQTILSLQPRIEALARDLMDARDVLYIGRGTSYPLAMEGALKLKETSYIHAEGYAAGELKHGPISLVDPGMPVIVVGPQDRYFEKTLSNMQEVIARGGRVVLITDEGGAAASQLPPESLIVVPTVGELVAPMILSLPLQMLAYQIALAKGTDVDKPRNLAKSVTVE